MTRYFDIPKNKKPIFTIGDTYGHLTIITKPYYTREKSGGEHRRQFVDCVCDCGKVREQIQCSYIKRECITKFCDYNCKYNIPKTEVPKENKLCKLGEQYNNLTIVKEAFYHKLKGENRTRCVEVECICGKRKIYRESKVYAKSYKSCGCVWEYSGKKDTYWKHIQNTYYLSQEDYESLLDYQDNGCAICKSKTTKTSKTQKLHVDHCHATGKIRGLLCSKCNSGLGYFEDNPDFLMRAIDYLK
jgi:hypothetical protein